MNTVDGENSSGLVCLESLEEWFDLGTEGAFLRTGRIQGMRITFESDGSSLPLVSSGTFVTI
jgi:hypothetical protein